MDRRRLTLTNLVVAVAYASLALATMGLDEIGVAAVIWPAAGLGFAAVLRWGWRVLPGLAVGAFAAAAVQGLGGTESAGTVVLAAAGVAAGASIQALVGAWGVRRVVGARSPLATPRDILYFLAISGPAAAVLGATIGVFTQVATGILPTPQIAAAWVAWWAGEAMGVIFFGPITLMLLPDQRDTWNGRQWQVAIPSLIFSLALVAVFTTTLALERSDIRSRESTLIDDAVDDLSARIGLQQEMLDGIKGLLLSSKVVTAEEFATFTTDALARFPGLGAAAWDAVVGQEQLAGFEQSMREQAGYEDFRVTDRDAEGNPVPVASRPFHVVVQYIEPFQQFRDAVGFDIASDPVRRAVAESARDSATATATPPITLVAGSGRQNGMLVLVPVYSGGEPPAGIDARRSEIRGFAVGVYLVGDLFSRVFGTSRWNDYDLALYDVTEQQGTEPIASLVARSAPLTSREGAADATVWSDPFDMAGRDWVIAVTPVAGPLADASAVVTPLLLVGSLLVMFLLEAMLLLITGLEVTARREVVQRTFEATHDPLTGLVNRRGFMARLTELCADSSESAASHMLLYCDLDGFKAVNDRAGHGAGDAVLSGVADALRANARTVDVTARIGGDEFAVILVECPANIGIRTAEGIVAAVAEVRPPGLPDGLGIGVSIGAASFGAPGERDPDTVLRRADASAYAAKRDGGSRVRWDGDGGPEVPSAPAYDGRRD